MNYLYTEGLAKIYGDKTLFDNVSISINRGQKVALIAKNGSGKTTLLDIIAGKDTADRGTLIVNPNIKVGYLEQDPYLDSQATIMESIFQSSNSVLELIKEYEYCLAVQNTDPTQENEAKLRKLMLKMDEQDAWDYESKIKEILGKLKLTDINQPIEQLSGGQKKRVALADVLIQEPDFIIMDEPTNHLDIEMIEWLEQYLDRQNSTLLLVTHDRYFLDKITNEIVEIEDGNTYKYTGNYSYYLEKHAERHYNKRAEVEVAKSMLQKELEWMRRSPKARTTKAKSRIDSFYKLQDKASQKTESGHIQLNVKTERLGSKTIELKSVCKAYGDLNLIENFSYNFKRGEKTGIIGKNGSGKSTFLRLIEEMEKPDSGTIKRGDTINIGHYKQEGLTIPEDQKVIEVVRSVAEFITLEKGVKLTASQLLNQFLFPYPMQHNYVSKLSGGERRRLYLLTVLMKNPNFLILDEPTNDLDLMTLNILEDFLTRYQGCLLVVSHDRYFMDKIVDHLFIFEGNGKVRDFPGNYTDYRNKEKKEQAAQKKEAAPKKSTPAEKATKLKKKLSYNEKREFEQLEKDLEQLEIDKEKLESQLSDPNAAHEDLTEWSKTLGNIIQSIDTKTDRWLELSEYM